MSYIRTLVERRVLPLCRDVVGVFYSLPCRLNAYLIKKLSKCVTSLPDGFWYNKRFNRQYSISIPLNLINRAFFSFTFQFYLTSKKNLDDLSMKMIFLVKDLRMAEGETN